MFYSEEGNVVNILNIYITFFFFFTFKHKIKRVHKVCEIQRNEENMDYNCVNNGHKQNQTFIYELLSKKRKTSVLDLLVPGLASDTSTRGPVACERDW